MHEIAGATIAARAALVARVESSSGSVPRHVSELTSPDPPTLVRGSGSGQSSEALAPVASAEADTRLTWRGPGRRLSPRTAAISGIGIALVIGLVVATSVLLSKRHSGVNELENAPPQATSVAASGPPLSSETSVPAPASASAVPTSTATARSTPRHPAPPSKKTAAPAAEEPPSSKAKCNPPYYIDKDGIKTFKPGCLN